MIDWDVIGHHMSRLFGIKTALYQNLINKESMCLETQSYHAIERGSTINGDH